MRTSRSEPLLKKKTFVRGICERRLGEIRMVRGSDGFVVFDVTLSVVGVCERRLGEIRVVRGSGGFVVFAVTLSVVGCCYVGYCVNC